MLMDLGVSIHVQCGYVKMLGCSHREGSVLPMTAQPAFTQHCCQQRASARAHL